MLASYGWLHTLRPVQGPIPISQSERADLEASPRLAQGTSSRCKQFHFDFHVSPLFQTDHRHFPVINISPLPTATGTVPPHHHLHPHPENVWSDLWETKQSDSSANLNPPQQLPARLKRPDCEARADEERQKQPKKEGLTRERGAGASTDTGNHHYLKPRAPFNGPPAHWVDGYLLTSARADIPTAALNE